MSNEHTILSERAERITKWLDGGCSSWGTPAQDIRAIVAALRQPTQSDALTVTDEMVERLAKYIANEESLRCKTLDAAIEHRSNWRRITHEAREMLTAALQEQENA